MVGTPPIAPSTPDLQPHVLGTSGGGGTVQSGIVRGAVSTFKIEPLKEGNWLPWQNRMTSILKLQNVYGLINGTVPKPDNDPTAFAEWEQKDLVAQVLIKNNLSDEQMVHVDQDTVTTAAAMWQSLRAVHETRGHSAITAAKRTFYGMRAADDVNIPEHIAEMRRQYNRLCQMGCKILDDEFQTVIVMSLPPTWDHFVASWQAGHIAADPEGKRGITSQELTSILVDEYNRRQSQTTHDSRAFYAQSTSQNKKRKVMAEGSSSQNTKGNKPKCSICGKDNHPTNKCFHKGKPKCGKCGKFGHKTDDCWGNNPPKRKGEKGKEKANAAKEDDDAEMSYVANANVSRMNEDHFSFYKWYADSATTSHLTNVRSTFIDYKPINPPRPVYGLGDGYVLAYGRGTVEAYSLMNGKPQKFYLKEALYTPDHSDNLLSIGRIDRSGGRIIFGDLKAVIYDNKNNEVVDGNITTNQLYLLNIYHKTKNTESSNNTTINEKKTWKEWHCKFGHVSITGLQKLLAGNLVDDFDIDINSAIGDCDACIQAKHSHAPFPKQAEFRSQKPGELTHTDVWGPASPTSWSGMRYNITFIDDCTRHCLCAQMKEKSETTMKLQQYLVLIERQYGYISKKIRMDKGREYLTNEFLTWCANKGIIIETTAPYSPSQNGVAERFNRTLIELSRAMIIAHNVPKYIWPEAVNHAAYIRNRSYTRAIQGKTPIEAWTNIRPSVAHLQEFGIPIWILNEQQGLSKLDPKSSKHIFVGFEDGPKAVKYYDVQTHRVKTSRNYIFTQPPTQIQGENEGEQQADDAEQDIEIPKKRKRPLDDNPDIIPRRSTRPRIQPDYRILNDPFLAFDPAPELAALACDPEEGHHISSSNELIGTIIERANLAFDGPLTLKDARESSEWPEWEKAIQIELDQLTQKNTWELADLPEDRIAIKNKWVFVKKYDKQGKLIKYKARLVAKGYSQIPGIDYFDVFSPVVRLETIRALLALAAMHDWEIQQMDVKGAYLNGILKEEVYMAQPEGYEDGSNKTCHLLKTLYGLKQSGREWNIELNSQLTKHGYQRIHSDPCVYIQKLKDDTILITIWVDDMLLFATSTKAMQIAKRDISGTFEVTDLGEPKEIVGIEITRDRKQRKITITQTKYIEAILAKYGLQDACSVTTPLDVNIKLQPGETETGNKSNNYASLIGSLMYAAVATRPDIAFAVNRLASFTANPTMCHWTAAKRVLRYLKGTKDIGITYSKPESESSQNYFIGYSDASFANNYDCTSVSGYAFLLAGGAITWGSKKQNIVSLSTTEAEYVCLSDAAREATWLRNLYQEVGFLQKEPTLVYGDNLSALAIAENPRYHKRTKHFDIKHHYIREQINNKTIIVEYLPTTQMTADIFTKALPKPAHVQHMKALGMISA